MKPACQFETRRFPQTDYFFHAEIGWRGYGSPYDDEGGYRRSHNLGRQYLIESARERAKEMAVFAVVVVASVWPVIYMMITVVKLLLNGPPLTE